jgi:hypothetical protein
MRGLIRHFVLIAWGLQFYTGLCVGQKYERGYVLLNHGDTLQGYIQTENWRKAPELVKFKSSPNAEIHTYSPLLIRSFRLNEGDWYFSFVGDIDPSSLLDEHLNYDPTPDTARVSMFIRAVVMGKASLYYAIDKNDRMHLFIQKDGGVIQELKYKKYYLNERVVANYRTEVTRRAIMSNQIYKEQLINLFADCPAVATGILPRPLSYAKNDIMDLVIAYNRCKNAPPSYSEKREKWDFEFAVHGGVNYSKLKLKSDDNSYFEGTEIENSTGYAVSLSLNSIIPRTRNAWSLYNELLARNFHSTGATGATLPVQLDLVYIKLLTMARYHFPNGNIRPFINGGITNSIALKDENLIQDSSGPPNDFLPYFRRYEQGVLLGGGATWKHISSDIRVEFSNAMSGYTHLKTSFTTMYLLVGYTF